MVAGRAKRGQGLVGISCQEDCEPDAQARGTAYAQGTPSLSLARRAHGGSPLQFIRLDLPIERRSFDAEDGGGLALVPVGVLERAKDVLLLDVFQRQRLVLRWRDV